MMDLRALVFRPKGSIFRAVLADLTNQAETSPVALLATPEANLPL